MVPDQIRRLLSAYVDGELTSRQLGAVRTMLARSAEARALLEKLQADAVQLRGLGRPGVSPDLSATVVQRLRATPCRPAARRTGWSERSVPGWLGSCAAAAVLAAVFCGSYAYFLPDAAPRIAQHADSGTASPIAKAEQIAPSPEIAPPEPRQQEPREAKPSRPTTVRPTAHRIADAAAPQPAKSRKDMDSVSAKPAPTIEGFEIVDANTTLSASLRDLDQKPLRQKLLNSLRAGESFRLELTGSANAKAIDVLGKVFRAQGLTLLTEEFAAQRSRMHSSLTDYVVLADDLMPEEATDLLGRLGKADREADPKRLDAARFGDVMLLPLTADDQKELGKLLGTELPATTPNGSAVAAGKAALLLSYNPPRPLPGASKEIKRFLDARGPRKAGALRIMFVLRAVTP